MGVQISEIEIELAVSPLRIFKAAVYDSPTLVVKLMPQVYKKIDLIHGDGGVGTIKIYYLQEGISSVDIVKEKVEAVDEKMLSYSFTVTQGPFPTGVEKIQVDMIFNATADGAGTIIQRKTYFYTTCDNAVDETEIAAFNEQAVGLFKAFESYLVANADA